MNGLLIVLGMCAAAAVPLATLALLMRWGRKLAATGQVAPEKLKPTDRVTLIGSESRSTGQWVRFRNVSDRRLDRFFFRVRAMQEGVVIDEILEVVFLPTRSGGEREIILSLVDNKSGRALNADRATVSVESLGGYEPWRWGPRATEVGGIRRFFMGIATRSAGLSVRFKWETDLGRKMRSKRLSFYLNLAVALMWTGAALRRGSERDPLALVMALLWALLTLVSGVQFWRARRRMQTMLR